MKYLIDSPHLSQYCPVHQKIANASQSDIVIYNRIWDLTSYHALHLDNGLLDGGDKGKEHRDVHEESSADDHIVQ